MKAAGGDGEMDEMARNAELEKANRKLKQQNFMLLEQLQAAQATIDHYATTVKELKAKIDALEKANGEAKEDKDDPEKMELNLILNNNNHDYRASVS